jgi:hypothetical protein
MAAWGASFTASCIPARDPSPSLTSTTTSTVANRRDLATEDERTPVVLVVLDGVRWQEVFVGVDAALAGENGDRPGGDARDLLPNLYAATDTRGAIVGAPGHGRAIAASGPNFVSMPGYTEIFEGRPPDGCRDNACEGALGPTIVDEIRDRATANQDVAVFASWERIGSAATREPSRIVLSAGRSAARGASSLADDPEMQDTLERARDADPYPGSDDFRPDRYTAALALRYLDLRRPEFLFVGLGEADEYAHRGDYAGYLASLRDADRFAGQLFATLDRMGERGRRTLVLFTSDHGRARDYRDHGARFPESARVWLAAFGGPVRARGFAAAPRSRRLADVAPTIRAVLDLKPDEGPLGGTPLWELFDDTDPLEARSARLGPAL